MSKTVGVEEELTIIETECRRNLLTKRTATSAAGEGILQIQTQLKECVRAVEKLTEKVDGLVAANNAAHRSPTPIHDSLLRLRNRKASV